MSQFYSAPSGKFVVVGNLKMNGTRATLLNVIKNLNMSELNPDVEVIIAPSMVYLGAARRLLRKDISIAVQNVCDKPSGAFTGETSVSQASDMGAQWAIIGHKERRMFGEKPELIGRNAKAALNGGLNMVYVLGESPKQRESYRTLQVVVSQLEKLIGNVTDWSKVVLAYEPIWAIGQEGVTMENVNEVLTAIRTWITVNISEQAVSQVRIIYGGSVTPENCSDLLEDGKFDGFLVGSAVLKSSFVNIINCQMTPLEDDVSE